MYPYSYWNSTNDTRYWGKLLEYLPNVQHLDQSSAGYWPGIVFVPSHWDWRMMVIVATPSSLLCTYLVTSLQSAVALHSKGDGRRAPIAPYWFPVIGHLIFFLWDSAALFTSVVDQFGSATPIRLSLITNEICLISGAQNLNLIWQNSQWLTAKAGHLIGLETILDTPKRSLEFYKADNSGIGMQPLPQSNVLSQNRVWHLTHQPIVDSLSGPKLRVFVDHFQAKMRKRILEGKIGDTWVEVEDLFTFVYSELLYVQLELLCGTFFFAQNPSFVDDFRRFHHAMIYLKKSLPKWMIPRSCRARDVCLTSIKKWHHALRVHNPNRLIDTGEVQNAAFGHEIMRSRPRIMAKMKAMDVETAASADLGMLWALNANSGTATFWLLLELFRNPSLQSSVQAEINMSISARNTRVPELDINKLGHLPLLQSLYAETLRLRAAVAIVQSAEFGDFKFREWIFPKDKLLVISSRISHMNQDAWNTGIDNAHPVNTFWAERFLVFPDDPTSGPLKKTHKTATADTTSFINKGHRCSAEPSAEENRYKTAKFSIGGLAGTWIPYGGGPGMCPGRHFAKQIIMLASAMMFTAFEVELRTGENWTPEADLRYDGLGVSPPKGAIPCRIRKRQIPTRAATF